MSTLVKIAFIIAAIIALVIVFVHLLPWLIGGGIAVFVVHRWLTRNRRPSPPPQWPWIK